MDEATLKQTDTGLVPEGEGWFVLNLAEASWHTVPGGGTWCSLEPDDQPSRTLGLGPHLLMPGDTPGYYHAESEQEGFLVLQGECVAVVEGQERRMRQWDYLHSPPGTYHITVGASEQPCVIFMVGTRSSTSTTHYLADPVAARHGAAVERSTDSAREAYAERPPITRVRAPWPPPRTP